MLTSIQAPLQLLIAVDRSIDRWDDDHQTIKVDPCNSPSLSASFLAPGLPRLLTNHNAHLDILVHLNSRSKVEILGLTSFPMNPAQECTSPQL